MKTVAYALAAAMAMSMAATELAANGAVPLAGSAWRPAPLSGFAGTDERPVQVEFETADKVSGFAGCNRFFGAFKHGGDKLTLGPLATTRMACPEDVMDRETRFLKILETARLVEVTESELLLKTWEGAVLLRLTPHR